MKATREIRPYPYASAADVSEAAGPDAARRFLRAYASAYLRGAADSDAGRPFPAGSPSVRSRFAPYLPPFDSADGAALGYILGYADAAQENGPAADYYAARAAEVRYAADSYALEGFYGPGGTLAEAVSAYLTAGDYAYRGPSAASAAFSAAFPGDSDADAAEAAGAFSAALAPAVSR